MYIRHIREDDMARSTVFKTNRGQAVRLPKTVAFPDGVHEVEVTVVGSSRIITPVGKRWDDLFAGGERATEGFMQERVQPPAGQREPL
jgi:antitoxin VapB